MTKYFYDLGSGCDLPSVVGVLCVWSPVWLDWIVANKKICCHLLWYSYYWILTSQTEDQPCSDTSYYDECSQHCSLSSTYCMPTPPSQGCGILTCFAYLPTSTYVFPFSNALELLVSHNDGENNETRNSAWRIPLGDVIVSPQLGNWIILWCIIVHYPLIFTQQQQQKAFFELPPNVVNLKLMEFWYDQRAILHHE